MAEVTPIRTAAEAALLELFPAVKARLPGGARAAGEREKAIAAFGETGLPHRRVEAWKYTDLRALLREAAPLAPAPGPAEKAAAQKLSSPVARIEAIRLVLVDGAFAPELSDVGRLPAGVEVVSFAEALAKDHSALAVHLGSALRGVEDPLVSLNTAFATDGVVVRIAEDVTLGKPLLIRTVATRETATATFLRTLVVVEDNAQATIIESHEGVSGVAHQANSLVELVVGDGAQVHHVRLRTQGAGDLDLSTLGVRLGARTNFRHFATATAPEVARHQITLRFAGESSEATLAGAALLNGSQHGDTTLVVEHAAPHCTSRELFKHVLDGEATGVFQGKIIVEPDAQKTDGRMMSQAVLLADGAAMNNKPELEIFADDVQCAHGATCGALDDDLLFYLRARGLPKPEAEALMLQAFVGEAIETMEHEGLREVVEAVVESWLRCRV
jgi:Fe-S cluster assembly protein SufD